MQEERKEPAANGGGRRTPRRIGYGGLILAVCLTLVVSILLTWSFTTAAAQKRHLQELEDQRAYYAGLLDSVSSPSGDNLAVLEAMIQLYSLYADGLDESAMLEAAFKAYVEATGDVYAKYYTQAEYAELTAENNGDFCGIGVTVVQSTYALSGGEAKVYRIIEVYEDSPALAAGMRAGDLIYAVKVDGAWQTVGEMGFDKTLLVMRGEEGSEVEVMILRENAGEAERIELKLARKKLTTHSVRSVLCESDATVGIVQITGFDMTTPGQFKANVNRLLELGVEHFIFDVRNNPGGDLQSIVAVLSYFLQEGDMVISAIDKNEQVAATYTVRESQQTGSYAGCSVAREEIGMYAALDFAVLCNENTASAAEVFVATLRDYRAERGFRTGNIVGATTFGKGIMQTTRRIPFSDGTEAYLKLTTHAYVTKCGTSYHGVGIVPDVAAELNEEAKKQPLSALAQSEDGQLLAAVALFR